MGLIIHIIFIIFILTHVMIIKLPHCIFTGKVANLHLALCDQLPKGACDDLAKELAKSQSQAVDFPKTGIVPSIPTDALW